jgi:hypothetical protein
MLMLLVSAKSKGIWTLRIVIRERDVLCQLFGSISRVVTIRRLCCDVQVLVALSTLGAVPSSALTQQYYDASLPMLDKTPADSIAAVLRALQDAKLQPDVAWLEAVVQAVRSNIKQYTVLQLNGVAKALTEFEAAGLRKPWLQDFVAYLKEFFLY